MALNMFAPQPQRNKPLVEFRAGKMLIRGKQVVPDKRKGLVQLIQSPDDGLIHFLWKDRTTQQVETDLIIFPEDASLRRIKQCTTGRVYLLEWKTSDRRMFFWMQEPSDEKDEENCTKINQNINTPPSQEQSGASALAGMDQSQLMAMMGGMGGMPGRRAAAGGAGGAGSAGGPGGASGGAAPRPAAAAPASGGGGGISSDHLSNILSVLGVDSSQAPAQRQPAQQQQQQRAPDTANLAHIMTPEALMPLLSDPAIRDQLLSFMPEGNRSPEELQQVMRSPQFQQALGQFNTALQSGQLGQLMPMFGLPSNIGGPQGGVSALLRALQENAPQQTTQQPAQPSQQQQQQQQPSQQPGSQTTPQQPQQPSSSSQTQQQPEQKPPAEDKKDDNMDQS
eukprot:TRINITY_DN395_c0_g3_i1.p1 TRINITY_DN395_c0_g3~~TRINITY_DN395_c0_g3_i1.p1  ORF type:complete len:394 (-),score=133.63 TRINITY_DN395_c0_g3_i1:69-1250(-)